MAGRDSITPERSERWRAATRPLLMRLMRVSAESTRRRSSRRLTPGNVSRSAAL